MKETRVKIYSVAKDAYWSGNQAGYTDERRSGVWKLDQIPVNPDAIVLSLNHLRFETLPSDAQIAIIQH